MSSCPYHSDLLNSLGVDKVVDKCTSKPGFTSEKEKDYNLTQDRSSLGQVRQAKNFQAIYYAQQSTITNPPPLLLHYRFFILQLLLLLGQSKLDSLMHLDLLCLLGQVNFGQSLKV